MVKPFLRSFDRRIAKGRLFLLRHGVVGERYRAMQRMSRNAILIGGSARSGTSLLLSLMSVIRGVYAIPFETRAFYPVGYYSEDQTPGDFRIDNIYDHLLEANVAVEDYGRWCEKTPKNILLAESLLDYFGPGMRFIHMVRDGRSVVTSRHAQSPDDYYVAPEEWVRRVQAGRAIESHPQVRAVRYEDLTADPLAEMRQVCDFLGEPFDEETFRAYPESAAFGVRDFFVNQEKATDHENIAEQNEGVHGRSVERWQQPEHAEVVDRLLAQSEARALLRHYGYTEASES